MATINQTGRPTLLDVLQRLDPNGSIARIAEVLTINSPLIQRLPWYEANGPDGHLLTTRTALPALGWRKYNEGVDPSKSTTGQFTETCGMLDGISEVDVALAKRNGNEGAYRASEDMAFVASYRRYLEDAFFYASTKTNPERIMGLSPRLDALSGIPFASQVIPFDATAAGSDITSIWLLGFGEKKIYGIYPKGSKAGLDMKDMGEELVTDANSKKFRAYRSYFSWNCGLCVEDARYVVRIANIDTGNGVLVGTGDLVIQAMAKATEQLQDLEDCEPVFFMNRKLRTYLRLQSIDTTKNSTLTYENVGGKPVLSFQGIPIMRSDAILNTEAALA